MRNIQFDTLENLADLLHLSGDGLAHIIKYKKYRSFKIKKRSGGYRQICAPNFQLKVLQKWILTNILEKEKISSSATAFIKNCNGIKQNALIHKNNKFIFEIDLKDFYPSISDYMVKKMFLDLGYSKFESNILSSICTYKKELPQGGITSPYISNLVFKNLDEKIEEFCISRNIKYSRYADDLTFSFNDLCLTKELKQFLQYQINKHSRFRINAKKTRILYPSQKQTITGITVNNNQIKCSNNLKQKIRITLYNLFKSEKWAENYSQQWLVGTISYIHSVEDESYSYAYINKCIKYIANLMEKFNSKSDFGLLKILQKMKNKHNTVECK